MCCSVVLATVLGSVRGERTLRSVIFDRRPFFFFCMFICVLGWLLRSPDSATGTDDAAPTANRGPPGFRIVYACLDSFIWNVKNVIRVLLFLFFQFFFCYRLGRFYRGFLSTAAHLAIAGSYFVRGR